MAADPEDLDSTRSLVNSDTEPEPQASTCRGSPRWRMLSLLAGLAIGTFFAIYSRQGKTAVVLDGFLADGITMLDSITEVEIPVIIRDFKEEHPDFQRDDKGLHKGLVKSDIGTDGKPVYVGGVTIENKESFDQWYRDVDGVNMRIEKKLKLVKNAAGQFVFDKEGYFPIDGEGFKDHRDGHNYFFTLEMHHIFQYHGDEIFKFRGDDDLWVFVNGKLVIDLGGTHVALARSVALKDLGLEVGKPYPIDLFFGERHTVDSNFRIETTIHLEEAIDPSQSGNNDQGQCCLIKALNFLCFDEKQWWTFWC